MHIVLGWFDVRVTIAGEWYTSETFWAAAGVFVAVVVAPVTVWVTVRVAHPKRRLWYSMPVITPLITSDTPVSSDLEVRLNGVALDEPHAVEVELACRGLRDIPSSAFDSGKPLRLDLGAPIVKVLNLKFYTNSYPLAWKIDGSILEIHPCLIKRNSVAVFSMLIDGYGFKLTCPNPPLIDVQVRRKRIDRRFAGLFSMGYVAAACALWVVITTTSGQILKSFLDAGTASTTNTIFSLALLPVFGAVVATFLRKQSNRETDG